VIAQQVLKPRFVLNKAFLKVKPSRDSIEKFKFNLINLLSSANNNESEEFHKNLLSDFLKQTYYQPEHFINTKGRNDLVIHNGKTAQTPVGVIIETKRPGNITEMPNLGTSNFNVKSFHELILYYLRERISNKNLELKHLIITNLREWFIFDAQLFERLFASDKILVKNFIDFEEKRLSGVKTDFFYKQIAEVAIVEYGSQITATYFNFKDYERPLRNNNKVDDNQLIALFKLLSPEHLLKLPFANDSNTLDKNFYSELLHIIGLAEVTVEGKKLIERNKDGQRHLGTMLEDAIIQLDSMDKLDRLDNPRQYGETHQQRLFNVALTLSITWINRILFLKLLEAQLLSYHKGSNEYAFLSLTKIKGYDDLNRSYNFG
jgi:adenine-specific DNA-methyltransferase